jgi:hypothetical protein
MFFSGCGPDGMPAKSLEFLPHWIPMMPSSPARAGTASMPAATMPEYIACRFIECVPESAAPFSPAPRGIQASGKWGAGYGCNLNMADECFPYGS